MPFIEKNPLTTAVVVAGWVDPTNGLGFNGSYTYSETDTAEQEYDGYNLRLEGSEKIVKVFARIKGITKVTTVATGDTLTFICYLKVYDGSSWTTYQVTKVAYACTTTNDENLTSTEGDASNSVVAIDVTSVLNTIAKLASAKTRLLLDITATSAGCTARWSVDSVSLLVCYSYRAGVMVRERPSPRVQKSLATVKEYLQLEGET